MTGSTAQRIRDIRRAKGWSQETLAYHADVAVKTVHNAEGQAGVSARSYRRIAEALGLEPTELITSGAEEEVAS